MIVLDSNVWIAFFNPDDSNHQKARKVFSTVQENIGIPEYVLLEVATILAQKIGKDIANQFMQMAMANEDAEILFSSKEFLESVADFYVSQKNEKLSFVDYSLLYISSQTKIITFDRILEKEIQKLSQ